MFYSKKLHEQHMREHRIIVNDVRNIILNYEEKLRIIERRLFKVEKYLREEMAKNGNAWRD